MPLGMIYPLWSLPKARWKAWSFSYPVSSTEMQASRWYLLSFCCQWAPGGCWTLLPWAWSPMDCHEVTWCCDRLSLRRQYQAHHSLASSLEGVVNGRCLFLSHVIFLGTSVFHLSLVLPRSSLSLLLGVYYLLLPELCLDCPFIGTCRALSFWSTSVTSLAGLKSPPDLSNSCTHQYDACGLGGTYSTCFCLFFLLEC